MAETAFDLADLNRKLATARALLSYEQKCAETRLLEAAEEQRQLRVKLIHLEPECENLQYDLAEYERYIEEVDAVLAATTERLEWSEGRVARYKERNKELEEKLQSHLVSEGSERGVLAAELEDMRRESRALEDKVKLLEKEVAALKGENGVLQEENTELKEETSSLQEGKVALKEESIALKARLQDHVDRLRKAITTKQSLEAEHTTEKDALEKELSVLRAELEDSEVSAKRKIEDSLKSVKKEAAAERAAFEEELSTLRLELSNSQKAISRLQKSTTTTTTDSALRSAFKKETARREELEKEIASLTKDWDHRQTALETALEKSRIKIAKLTALKAAAENPKKRPPPPSIPFEDDNTVKRQRQERPVTSDLSLTPFFTKQAIVTTDSPLSPSAAMAPSDTNANPDETSIIDRSTRNIVIPAAIESLEPTRLLLAGSNRKRRPKAKLPLPPTAIPEESPEPEPVKEKSKPKPRPKKFDPLESPHMFDSPSSEYAPKAAPVRKRKAPVLRKNAFKEDDGTGRLVLATGEGGEKNAMATNLAARMVATAFAGEISPAKKRPEALKGWFPGGKK